MTSLLSRIFGYSKPPRCTQPRRARISLEALEDRRVPAFVVLSQGVLSIYLGNLDVGNVRVQSDGPNIIVTNWNVVGSFDAASVSEIFFQGSTWPDRFVNSTSLASTAYGGGSNDTLSGGSGVDDLHGGPGNDSLYGGAGNDTMGGDGGNDSLHGNHGNDVLSGGPGDDWMYGGDGTDLLMGGDGADHLYGNSGRDEIYGQNGDDTLDGGDDGFADLLSGGAGRDCFQAEGWGVGYYGTNRDNPVDFNFAEDSLFGVDFPETIALS